MRKARADAGPFALRDCGRLVAAVAAVVVDDGLAPFGFGGEQDAGVAGVGVEAEGEIALAIKLKSSRASGYDAGRRIAAEGLGRGKGNDCVSLRAGRLTAVRGDFLRLGGLVRGVGCSRGCGCAGFGILAGLLAHVDFAAIQRAGS